MQVEQIYKDRRNTFKTEADVLAQSEKRLSLFRLIFFIVLVAVIILLFQLHWIAGVLSIYVAFFLFRLIVKKHEQTVYAHKIADTLQVINSHELEVLQNEFSQHDDGLEFQDITHRYTSDLDVFGEGSLFQYVTRCQSYFGKSKLAFLFQGKHAVEEIEANQQAIKELEPMLEWRQQFQAISRVGMQGDQIDSSFVDWLQKDADITFKPIYFLLFPAITIALLVVFIKFLPWMSYLLAFVPAGIFAMRNAEKINEFESGSSKHANALKAYSTAFEWIQDKDFMSQKNIQLKSMLIQDRVGASSKIKKLSFILHQLDMRYNFFGLVINVLFPWDYYYSYQLQSWKDEHKISGKVWFQTLGEFEALSSLAALAYNNPEWAYPTFSENNMFSATEIGHPLIHRNKRVRNDFHSATQNHIKIVTGSNMGGKSTFLRTIGLNIILANCGSKVCANNLTLPHLNVYTSMRTLDALNENTSSFYAELKRLKTVLDAVDESDNVYFLLDEILKGTNSNDRHTGAKALIKGLLKKNGAGLISTHDLELGNLASEHPDQLENVCFEVDIKEDQLFFDYKLKKGVSKSFNATHLMRSMGIEV